MIHEAAIIININSSEKELISMNAFLDLSSASDTFIILRKATMKAILSTSSKTATGTMKFMNNPARVQSNSDDPVIHCSTSRFICPVLIEP
jgi:hypothetical protein